jgi:hypothetical protein
VETPYYTYLKTLGYCLYFETQPGDITECITSIERVNAHSQTCAEALTGASIHPRILNEFEWTHMFDVRRTNAS